MRLGIVGSEEIKFTPETKNKAILAIKHAIITTKAKVIISGGCHLGGIDIWAANVGRALDREVVEHLPAKKTWEGGYKQRNILIAEDSDKVICITIKDYPKGYRGMRFNYCYHCGTDNHIKSGGCWTMKYAKKLGKEIELIVIE